MYPLLETIKIRQGEWVNLDLHQRRLQSSRRHLWGELAPLDIAREVSIPSQFCSGVVKCRIFYGKQLGEVDFEPYYRKEVRSLQAIACSPFDYHLKFRDRHKLEMLYVLRGQCHEILLVINGMVTDTSYSNVAMFDGICWYTPQRPLLMGTQRDLLIRRGILLPRPIHIEDLAKYKKVVLINAMLEFQPDDYIRIADIHPWQQKEVTFETLE